MLKPLVKQAAPDTSRPSIEIYRSGAVIDLLLPVGMTGAGWSSQLIERYSARRAASSCARAVAQPPSRSGCTFNQT